MVRHKNPVKQFWWQFRKRFRSKVTLTGRNYDVARRMLNDMVEICEQADIDFRVDSGTLLGIARDGDLIPWDDDLDCTLGVEDLARFKSLFPEIRRRGWRIADDYLMPQDDVAWRKNDARSIKIRNHRWWRVGRGRIVLDIFVRYRHGEHVWWANLGKINRVERKYFDGYDRLDFHGRKVRAPHDHEQFLALVFGDWRTPDRSFQASVQDGTIVDRLDRDVSASS